MQLKTLDEKKNHQQQLKFWNKNNTVATNFTLKAKADMQACK